MASLALDTRWFGTFLYEGDQLLDHRLFPEEPAAIADRLSTVREGGILEEERDLLDEHGDRGTVQVRAQRLLEHARTREGSVPGGSQDPGDHGFETRLLQAAATEVTEAAIEEQLGEDSRHLVQAVAYLDEAHEIENRMGERLASWLRLHAPGVVDEVDDPVELAKRVLRDPDGSKKGAELWPGEPSRDPLDPHERRALEGLASSLVQQAQAREPLEDYVGGLARRMAPNVAKLSTPEIAARLIRHAGGVEELAKMPASTIQMLGAEGAVFRHLSEGADPPKHGVIYRHPRVHEAHPQDRGSIARAFAAKLAIAARADAFTGNDVAPQLEADLEARVQQIQRRGRRRATKHQEGGS